MKQEIRMSDGSFREVHRVSIEQTIYDNMTYYVTVSYWIPGVGREVLNATSLAKFDTLEAAKTFKEKVDNNFVVNSYTQEGQE